MLLPMPPMPSSATRRQRSCTIHCVSSATSTSRPAKWLTSRASTRSTRGKAAGSPAAGAAGVPCGGESGTGEQVMQPVLIEQHLLVRRLPQRTDLLLLAPGGKRLLLHPQANELFEALGFGVAQASLPLGHRAPGDAQQLTQRRLAQADGA